MAGVKVSAITVKQQVCGVAVGGRPSCTDQQSVERSLKSLAVMYRCVAMQSELDDVSCLCQLAVCVLMCECVVTCRAQQHERVAAEDSTRVADNLNVSARVGVCHVQLAMVIILLPVIGIGSCCWGLPLAPHAPAVPLSRLHPIAALSP